MPKPVRNGGRNGADPAGTAGDDDDEDAPITREELTTLVNAAVTTQVVRRLAPLQRQIEAMPQMVTDGVTAAVTAAMGASGGQQRQQPPGGQQGQQGQNGQQQPGGQESPQLVEMRQQLEQLQGKLKAQETANEAAQRRVRETERDTAITTALGKIGVDPARMRGAAAVIRESLVEIKDKDAPGGVRYVYRSKRDGFEEDLDIAGGAAEWGKTDEGKAYMAPTQAARGGSGARPGAGQGQGQAPGSGRGAPQDPGAAKAAKQEAALNGLMAAIQGNTANGTVDIGE